MENINNSQYKVDVLPLKRLISVQLDESGLHVYRKNWL